VSKYGKEIVMGFVPVLFAFLLFIGLNIIPLLLIVIIVTSLYVMNRLRTGEGFSLRTNQKINSKLPAYFTFDEIGGQERAKHELIEALHFLVKPELTTKLGIRPLKGILLTGPPGTGKTLMAKAAAHYTNSVFVSASGSEFVEMYVGVGASRIRDIFKEAKQRSQKENKENAIIFIDEIDVIGGKREHGQQKEYDQTLNQLLTEMDGIHASHHPRILLIAATNRKDMLDSALLRPGRFDRHVQLDLPDLTGRKHILTLHMRNKPIVDETCIERIAQQTFGFSGAQLENVTNEAAIYALRDGSDNILENHLQMAIDKVMMGEQTDRTTAIEERRRVAVHELGHAIIAEWVRPGSVSQITLKPRGQALGYVRHHPQSDQYIYSKSHLEEQIMISLGGAAAEELIFGERSTGSRHDFEQAVGLVHTMMECGLTKLGIIDSKMLTREEFNQVNSEILHGLLQKTTQFLSDSRSMFEQVLQFLLQEESMSGERFRTICQTNLQGDSL
jgi:cell division protease FtsH